jgi:A nuclease of the HNH/ENDO VII superfamily with conserved WHH
LQSYAPNPVSWIDPLGWIGEKPPHSPIIDKWTAKGGSVSVTSVDNAGPKTPAYPNGVPKGTWVYVDAQGRSVSYPNGAPDFSAHAVRSVDVPNLEGNHGKSPLGDYGKADARAGSAADYKNNSWHHHENMVTMQEVPRDIHGPFTHKGAVSKFKSSC